MGMCCADHVTPLYPQKLALTSPTGGGRSVGIVRSRTKATEFFFGNNYRTGLIIEYRAEGGGGDNWFSAPQTTNFIRTCTVVVLQFLPGEAEEIYDEPFRTLAWRLKYFTDA